MPQTAAVDAVPRAADSEFQDRASLSCTIDNVLKANLFNGVVFIAINSTTYTDADVWPVVVFCFNMLAAYSLCFWYLRKHIVWKQTGVVFHSLLVWQVVVLVCISSFTSIIWHSPARVIQTVFIQLTIICVDVSAPLLDTANSTALESKCVLFILAVGTFGIMFGVSWITRSSSKHVCSLTDDGEPCPS